MASLTVPIHEEVRGLRSSADRLPDATFRAFLRAIGLLERAMQPYFAGFGITASQWGAMRMLHRAELEGHEALRMSDLSDRLLVRPPSMTGVIARLERDGLVARDAAPEDLRTRRVRLTEEGRRLVTGVLEVHAGQVSRVLGGLSDSEQEQLHALLGCLAEHLEGLLRTPTVGGGTGE